MIDPKTFNEEARAKKEEVAADESDDEKDKDKEEYSKSILYRAVQIPHDYL